MTLPCLHQCHHLPPGPTSISHRLQNREVNQHTEVDWNLKLQSPFPCCCFLPPHPKAKPSLLLTSQHQGCRTAGPLSPHHHMPHSLAPLKSQVRCHLPGEALPDHQAHLNQRQNSVSSKDETKAVPSPHRWSGLHSPLTPA